MSSRYSTIALDSDRRNDPCSSNGTRDVTDFAPKSGARCACSCSFTSRNSNARPFSFKQTKTEKAYGLFQKPSTCSTSGSIK